MTYESIAVSNENGIARITLNRPDRLNSFTRAMHGELREALANLDDARVVILTGAGRGFCAGQDLNDRAVAPGEAVDLGETVEESWNPLIRTLATLPQPVIARLLPTAMHPWMDPDRDLRLWPHEASAVYEAFNRIFSCRGHGWANLQSAHINLPFANDEEFGRLHAAIRAVLPIIPAK